jgi:hypothetical protein
LEVGTQRTQREIEISAVAAKVLFELRERTGWGCTLTAELSPVPRRVPLDCLGVSTQAHAGQGSVLVGGDEEWNYGVFEAF